MSTELLIKLGITLALICVGFLAGRAAERKHLKQLEVSEAKLSQIGLYPRRFSAEGFDAVLVTGSVVVAQDYFKMTLAVLLNLLGGRLRPYETLLERARREAVVRMKEQALAHGAANVYGFRLEVTSVDDVGGMVEAIAYGTALKKQ